jgi:hypothetical protein
LSLASGRYSRLKPRVSAESWSIQKRSYQLTGLGRPDNEEDAGKGITKQNRVCSRLHCQLLAMDRALLGHRFTAFRIDDEPNVPIARLSGRYSGLLNLDKRCVVRPLSAIYSLKNSTNMGACTFGFSTCVCPSIVWYRAFRSTSASDRFP